MTVMEVAKSPKSKRKTALIDFNKNTIPDLLQRRATAVPRDVAYHFPERDQTYTWVQLWHEVRVLAEGLLRLGVEKGDRIAIMLEGRVELIAALYATATVGAVAVPINTYSTAEEIRSCFLDAQPMVFLVGATAQGGPSEALATLVRHELAQGQSAPTWMPRHVFVHGAPAQLPPAFRPFADLLSPGHHLADAEFGRICRTVRASDPAFLLYTSGSTGIPRGVLRTVASFLVAETAAATGMGARSKAALARVSDQYTSRFSVMSLLPLYHLGGIGLLFTTLKVCNVRTVMLTHFNPVTALAVAEAAKPQFLVGTPFMLQAMLSARPQRAARLDSVVGLAFASAAVNGVMLDRITKELKNLYFFTVSYGSSEAGAVANGTCILKRNRNLMVSMLLRLLRSFNLLNGAIDYAEFNKTPYSICGKVDKAVEVRMLDLQTGDVLPAGQPGEISIRSHRVMRYAQDALTAESFGAGGWYKSGDVGYVDSNGYLIISDRLKRLISRGGEKISPVEIENVLLHHAGIAEAFVVGIPDELYGEQVCAAYVPAAGAALSIPVLRDELAARLSRFKVPKYFVAFPAFPLTASGKISGEEIKRQAIQQLSLAESNA